MNKKIPNSISVKIEFDDNLKKITNTSGYSITISTNVSFYVLLNSVFTEHPDIPQKYKPGELAFTINNNPPKEYSPLLNGDIVRFKII